MKFYITYGNNTVQRHCYSVVEAPTVERARDLVKMVCGSGYAFMYDEVQFIGQVDKYHLTEIPLQPSTVGPQT